VETIYTLMMAHGKLTGGDLKVEGAMVVLDVGTNDVRMARMGPDMYARKYEEVVRLLKEKGAVEVIVCELKCMGFMDVQPYSNAIHSLCRRLDIRGVKTQIGISHLAQDGYHILPSCLGVLAQMYALAILGLSPEEVLDGAVPSIPAPVVEGPRSSRGVGSVQAFPNVPTGKGEAPGSSGVIASIATASPRHCVIALSRDRVTTSSRHRVTASPRHRFTCEGGSHPDAGCW